STEGTLYTANLTTQIVLQVNVVDNFVQSLSLNSKANTTTSVLPMLTSWSQAIMMLHPSIELKDVDEIFHKFGVGPNADLSNVKETTFTYGSVNYKVTPI